jgi:hypothetical protein
MRTTSIIAALLTAAFILIAMPQLGKASFCLPGIDAEISHYVWNGKVHRLGEDCSGTASTEACPSVCAHGIGVCCASGMLLDSTQHLLVSGVFPAMRHERPNLQNGIDPGALPEPP